MNCVKKLMPFFKKIINKELNNELRCTITPIWQRMLDKFVVDEENNEGN